MPLNRMRQLSDIIKSRRSIRAFDSNVPPREIIQECLEAATWAPSATNQQPWEFIVLSGHALEKVNAVILEHFAERMQESTAFDSVPEDLAARQQEIFASLMAAGDAAGIGANDIFQRSLRFFDAPVSVYFVTRKRPDNQYLLSTAAALENFLLAAHAQGLGACWLNVTVVCAEEIKMHLGIASDRELVSGVALGYPDATSALNTFTRSRVPAEEVTTWLGF
jgi:nitroreductase